MDTLPRSANFELEYNRNVIRAKNSILGADDRAGVFAILEIIRYCRKQKIPLPSIILTNYEETGCVGVKKFCESNEFVADGVRLFIEMDRKGYNDYVCYRFDCPTEVEDYVESFGFISSNGSCSDVGELSSYTKIPHVNLSIGYYAQHTINERLHIDEMYLTIQRVISMIKNPIEDLYPVKEKPVYNYAYYTNNRISMCNGLSKPAKIYVLDRNKKAFIEVIDDKPKKTIDIYDEDSWYQSSFGV